MFGPNNKKEENHLKIKLSKISKQLYSTALSIRYVKNLQSKKVMKLN